MQHTVPTNLTILTGFLGAGKTTLLNRILTGHHGLRAAVIVNDFGAVNIDAELVVDVQQETISLANGCICCTIRGDLLQTVLELLRRPEPPEHILLECSGVSEPGAVAATFVRPELRRLIRVDAIIAVVDAEQVHQHDEQQDLITDQIAAADIVVLNKIDLASDNLRAGLRAWITMIVPEARIIETRHADAPLELLLGAADHRPAAEGQQSTASDGQQSAPGRPPSAAGGPSFETWSYTAERPFAFARLRAALEALPNTVYRAKGVVWLAEEPDRRVVAQIVGRRIGLTPSEPWGDAPRRSRLVLIGAPGSLNDDELRRRLDACLAP